LLSLKRTLLNGNSIVLAVDGPRGPRHLAKAGAFWLAGKTGVPIYPLGGAISRAFVFKKSWSKSRLPLPFSRVAACFGQPLWVTKDDLEKDNDQQCAILTEVIEKSMEKAAELLKSWPKNCTTSSGQKAEPT
jgi:lysophospholipid acyltransferase (LPLAT)-like uncharacterized protein